VDAINLKVSVLDQSGRIVKESEVVENARPVEIIDITLESGSPPRTIRPLAA